MKFFTRVKIEEKDYLRASNYYLKKYMGIREYILLAVLLIGGLVLYFAFNQLFILILCGITVLLMAGTIIAYVATSKRSYKSEFVQRNAHEWDITFTEEEIIIETLEDNGENPYTEKRTYEQIEKVAILKDRVYIYTGVATLIYIKYDSFEEGNFIDFCEFIKNKFDPAKFKMKTKRKQYPYGR